MNKILKHSCLLGLSAILLTACGSDSKSNANDRPASESGTTLSMACFEDVKADTETGMALVANCYVHTVDGNSDPVTGLKFNVSLVNNLKFASQGTGNIYATNPTTFTDDATSFATPELNIVSTDNLIILPSPTTTNPSYLGNWEIGTVSTELSLTNRAINLESAEDLSYVIGNETRYGFGTSASAHIVYPENLTGTDDSGSDSETPTNTDGFFFFNIVYDPSLRGETIYVGAHTTGNRMGTAIAVTLALEVIEENTDSNTSSDTDTSGGCTAGDSSCDSDTSGGCTAGDSSCSK